MELLLLLIPVAVVAIGVVAFKKFWPSAPEASASTSPTASLLSSPRQLTTGQIARGVFWGMWLFWLSQIIVGAVVAVVVLAFTGALLNNALGG